MNIIHAHYQPENPSGILFWAETSDAPAPKQSRAAKKPKSRLHPFCADTATLKNIFNLDGASKTVTLRLPAVRGVPVPSPQLIHNWDLDLQKPTLDSFLINGIWMNPIEALPVLLAHASTTDASTPPTPDLRYWSTVSALVLETIASHKLIPALVAIGDKYEARWLPVLDAAKDAARLAQLETAMPAVCRAGVADDDMPLSPRMLLNNFLNDFCDSLARAWGKSSMPRFYVGADTPAARWVEGLFRQDPTIKASPAQLKSLTISYKAWMRNLHVAGDATFRIAFRLQAPILQKEAWQLHYLIQAKDDPSLLIPAEEVWKKTKGALTHLGHRFEQPQEKLLTGLGYAARLFPPITDSLKGKRPTELSVDTNGAYTFLRETAPLLEGAGFGVLVPPWWNKKGARLGVKVKMKSKQEAGAPGKMTMENLVNYQWQLSLGKTELTEKEFKTLAKLKSPLVQIRGQWVTLDAEQIEAAIKFWEEGQTQGEITLLEAMRMGLGGETSAGGLPVDEVVTDGWLGEWMEQFKQSEKLEPLDQPVGLLGQLRPYQQYGYSWLAFLRKWGLGACLADDMGLGKTIQTISLLLREKEKMGKLSAPVLLIAPTSVVTNWEREIERFAPGLQTYIHRGSGRLRGEEMRNVVKGKDVMLTSYPVARLDAESIQSIQWLAVIVDEAQNIKNPAAKQTQAIRKFNAEFRIALTGTPVENRTLRIVVDHALFESRLSRRAHAVSRRLCIAD